jgi:hypothetical protein
MRSRDMLLDMLIDFHKWLSNYVASQLLTVNNIHNVISIYILEIVIEVLMFM